MTEHEKPELMRLTSADLDEMRTLFTDVFTRPPWNDDWSDTKQLDLYLTDLTGNPNSLSYGLTSGGRLIGISLGWMLHWCTGTEYMIREFCVSAELQHRGIGSAFLGLIYPDLAAQGITSILLNTERETPAFRFYLKNGFNVLEETVFLHRRTE